MIKIRDYEIKSSLTEWTVGDYEKIIKIFSNENLDNIDKYIKVLEFLGVPDEVLDTMGDEEFFNIINSILDSNINKNFVKEIEVDGFKYIAYEGEEYKLVVKDMAKIEGVLRENSDDILSKILAIIFKREDLSKTEHYDKAHLDYKSKIFKSLSADIVIPYMLLIEDKMVKKLIYLNNGDKSTQ